MSQDWTPEKLIKFEDEVASIFNDGEIKAPVHLSSGNEEPLIKIFRDVKKDDWVFCSWRSHYQCLLKGVEPKKLLDEIRIGHSISLCFPEQKVFSSAIVGGQLPIALGVALGEKREGNKNHVWCFLGDMTAETGMAQNCIEYAQNFDLPITFVIEDNGLSVMTPTKKVWGATKLRFERKQSEKVICFDYKSKYPHAGAGVRVQF
jgi:TPP-dependent pyruvate/acetoin dehydrogenase alpha subunit